MSVRKGKVFSWTRLSCDHLLPLQAAASCLWRTLPYCGAWRCSLCATLPRGQFSARCWTWVLRDWMLLTCHTWRGLIDFQKFVSLQLQFEFYAKVTERNQTLRLSFERLRLLTGDAFFIPPKNRKARFSRARVKTREREYYIYDWKGVYIYTLLAIKKHRICDTFAIRLRCVCVFRWNTITYNVFQGVKNALFGQKTAKNAFVFIAKILFVKSQTIAKFFLRFFAMLLRCFCDCFAIVLRCFCDCFAIVLRYYCD